MLKTASLKSRGREQPSSGKKILKMNKMNIILSIFFSSIIAQGSQFCSENVSAKLHRILLTYALSP